RGKGAPITMNNDASRPELQVREILGEMLEQSLPHQGRRQPLLLSAWIVAKVDLLAVIIDKGETGHAVQDIDADVYLIMKGSSQRPEPLAIDYHHPESAVLHITRKFVRSVLAGPIDRYTIIPLIVAANFAGRSALKLQIRSEFPLH